MKTSIETLALTLFALSILVSCSSEPHTIAKENIVIQTKSDFIHPSGEASIIKERNDDGTYSIGVRLPIMGHPTNYTFFSSSSLVIFDTNGHDIGLRLDEKNNSSIITGFNSIKDDYSIFFSFPFHRKSALIDELITSAGKIKLIIDIVSARDSVKVSTDVDSKTKVFYADSLGAWKYQENMEYGTYQKNCFIVRNPVKGIADGYLFANEALLEISVSVEDLEPVIQLSINSRDSKSSNDLFSSGLLSNTSYEISITNNGDVYSIESKSDTNANIKISGAAAHYLLDLLSSQTKATIQFTSFGLLLCKKLIFEIDNSAEFNAVYNYMLVKLSQN